MFSSIFVLICALKISKQQDFSPLVDIKTLSELPLEKLLQVKTSFEFQPGEFESISGASEKIETHPVALALQAKRKESNKRGGYDYDSYHPSKKSKGLGTIFSSSITILAFLAFGGYLLCLLLAAIRSNQNTQANNNAAMLAAIINRRRTTVRPIRLRRPSTRRPGAHSRHKRTISEDDDLVNKIWPNADPEKMYSALITLSEAYTHYHTDDKRYNYTARREEL